MAKIAEKIYSIGATSLGGRNGKVWSDDRVVEFEMKSPGGPGSEGAPNPEMLFAAGYAACFNGALALAAKLRHIRTGETVVKIVVSLGKDAEGNFQLAADVTTEIPGVDAETAEELTRAAHGICPYSRATQGNIVVTLHSKAV